MSDVRNLKQSYDLLDMKKEITHSQRLVELLQELRSRPPKVKNPDEQLRTLSDYLPDPVRTAIEKEIINLGVYLYEEGGTSAMISVFGEVEKANEKLAWDLDKKWSGIGPWLA